MSRSLRLGFLFGALFYGAPIALLHVVHNDLAAPLDAGVLALFCALAYGAWGAGAFLLGHAAARLTTAGPVGTNPRRALGLGLLVFHLMFWEVALLHGLTYDHYPFGRPASAWPMLAFLAVAAALVAAGAAVVARLLVPLVTWIWGGASARGGRLAAAGLLATVALPVAATFAVSPPPASAVAPASSPVPAVAPTGLKVVVLGLDGADWRVIDRLLAKGELPSFRRLVDEGASGPLATLPDANSAVIWASIYTGKRPPQHRVLDFYRIQLSGMRGEGVFPVHRTFFKEWIDLVEPLHLAQRTTVSRYSLQALPIWEILHHLGRSLGVVDGYYYSFPALRPETEPGYFLAYGLDQYYQELARGAGGSRVADLPLFLQPPELFREVKPFLEAADFDWQAGALRHLLATRAQPDFLSLYSHQPDTVQHLEWKWFEPQFFLGVTAEDLRRRADAIPERYRAFDRLLGDLLRALGEDTVLFVVSDHGHSPTLLHQSYYTQHRHGPPGILLARGGPVRRGVRLAGAQVYDLFPTWLYLLGLPLPEDRAGGVLFDLLDPAFVAAHPAGRVSTYEGRWPNPHRAGARSGLDQEEIRKLRALGYL